MTVGPEGALAPVVFAANSAWNILNFRRPLVEALVADGRSVVVLAPDDGNAAALRALGAEFVPMAVDSSGTSVMRDARLFVDYLSALRRLRPAAFLGFTIKPNIYGSMAAGLLGVRTVNNISGLGTAFLRPGFLNRLVRMLYRFALRRSHRVFFQNAHDRDLFVVQGMVRAGQAAVIPGSGIDLARFRPVPPRPEASPFRFLFVGRLLRDKGIAEYAEAARQLRERWPAVEFAILGFVGSDNRTAVPIATVERWVSEGIVDYLGETADVRPFLADCDCVVLPSYREGLSRSLLEAAAVARPIVASDVPGCREVVEQGRTGLLCEPRSVQSLADAMEAMLRLPPEDRHAMGRRGREKMEREFDQALVVEAYREALA